MKTRISPDVFDSASRIAFTIRSCSSLLRNSLVRIRLPASARTSTAKASSTSTKSAKAAATRRPTTAPSAAETHWYENRAASARGVTVATEPSHHPRDKAQNDEEDD